MFEVKYPFSHGLDGRVHRIRIVAAYSIFVLGKPRTIIIGIDDSNRVCLEVECIDGQWVKIPHTDSEYESINNALVFNNDMKDITDHMYRELDGKRITNIEEIKETKSEPEPQYLTQAMTRAKIKVFYDPLVIFRKGGIYITYPAAEELGFVSGYIRGYSDSPPLNFLVDDNLSVYYYHLTVSQYKLLLKKFEVEKKLFTIVIDLYVDRESNNHYIRLELARKLGFVGSGKFGLIYKDGIYYYRLKTSEEEKLLLDNIILSQEPIYFSRKENKKNELNVRSKDEVITNKKEPKKRKIKVYYPEYKKEEEIKSNPESALKIAWLSQTDYQYLFDSDGLSTYYLPKIGTDHFSHIKREDILKEFVTNEAKLKEKLKNVEFEFIKFEKLYLYYFFNIENHENEEFDIYNRMENGEDVYIPLEQYSTIFLKTPSSTNIVMLNDDQKAAFTNSKLFVRINREEYDILTNYYSVNSSCRPILSNMKNQSAGKH